MRSVRGGSKGRAVYTAAAAHSSGPEPPLLFNSLTFLVFFAVVLALHYAPVFPWRVKKFNLLIASYIFYGAWNPPFVILLWLSTVLDWYVAKHMARTEVLSKRRLLLILSIIGNLGMLGYFKYGEF